MLSIWWNLRCPTCVLCVSWVGISWQILTNKIVAVTQVTKFEIQSPRKTVYIFSQHTLYLKKNSSSYSVNSFKKCTLIRNFNLYKGTGAVIFSLRKYVLKLTQYRLDTFGHIKPHLHLLQTLNTNAQRTAKNGATTKQWILQRMHHQSVFA